jgi:hypothetical protein
VTDRLAELEAEIGEAWAKIMRPLYDERDALLVARAETTRYTVPRKAAQSETQQKLQRCPRCRGQLDER